MPRLSDIGKQFFDSNGDPLAGGKLYFYETGTTTLATTYSDSSESVANANPVILDADGRMSDVFYPGFLKIVLRDSSDVLIETRDPVGFSASVTGIPTGGTDGQVLTKQSSTDGDVDWEDASGGGGGSFWTFDPTIRTADLFFPTAGTYYLLNASGGNFNVVLDNRYSEGDIIGFTLINGSGTVSFAQDDGQSTTVYGQSSVDIGDADLEVRHVSLVYDDSADNFNVFAGSITIPG